MGLGRGKFIIPSDKLNDEIDKIGINYAKASKPEIKKNK